MKKTLALSLLLALGVSTICAASPLKNYGPGKTALDLGVSLPTSNNFENSSIGSKKTAPYFGATVGLNKNMALNYKWNQYKNKGSNEVNAQQINLMYKIIPQLDVFAGYLATDTELHGYSKDRNSLQVGLQGRVELPLLCTLWGRVGVGEYINSYEVGVSRTLVPNIDLNLSYYDNKFKKSAVHGLDARAKGLNVGVTVKI